MGLLSSTHPVFQVGWRISCVIQHMLTPDITLPCAMCHEFLFHNTETLYCTLGSYPSLFQLKLFPFLLRGFWESESVTNVTNVSCLFIYTQLILSIPIWPNLTSNLSQIQGCFLWQRIRTKQPQQHLSAEGTDDYVETEHLNFQDCHTQSDASFTFIVRWRFIGPRFQFIFQYCISNQCL